MTTPTPPGEPGIAFGSAPDVAAAIRRREVSAVDLVDAQLAQIDRLDDHLHAFITVSAKVRSEAEAATAAIARGAGAGPLHGLTVAIKDVIDTAGLVTSYGSASLATNVPRHDALVVDRLRRAGALVIGKTNTPEFAAQINTTNDLVGTTLNPWDTRYSSGGSSGGSAVALATGMATLALGTDHGGSVRFPAAWNGVVGLRPTPGRVPAYPSPWLGDVFDVIGPMARTVGGVRMMLECIAGDDPRVPVAGPVAARPAAEGWRVAWSPDLGGLVAVEPEIRRVTAIAINGLIGLGVIVEERSPDLRLALDAIGPLRAWRSLIVHQDRLGSLERIGNRRLRSALRAARRLKATDVARAERARSDAWALNAGLFESYDALALPTTQFLRLPASEDYPSLIDGLAVDPLASTHLTYAITMMGWPAVSIPAGFSADGLPVGLQLVGPRGSEARLLDLAEVFETAFPFHKRVPPISEPGASWVGAPNYRGPLRVRVPDARPPDPGPEPASSRG